MDELVLRDISSRLLTSSKRGLRQGTGHAAWLGTRITAVAGRSAARGGRDRMASAGDRMPVCLLYPAVRLLVERSLMTDSTLSRTGNILEFDQIAFIPGL